MGLKSKRVSSTSWRSRLPVESMRSRTSVSAASVSATSRPDQAQAAARWSPCVSVARGKFSQPGTNSIKDDNVNTNDVEDENVEEKRRGKA
jgi:hypothetical protein